MRDLQCHSVVVLANMFDDEDEAKKILGEEYSIPAEETEKIIKDAEAFTKSTIWISARSSSLTRTSQEKITNKTDSVISSFTATQMAASSASHVESKATERKLEIVLQDLWDILVRAGHRSKLLRESQGLETKLKSQIRQIILAQWADMPVTSIKNYIRGWQAWTQWCGKQNLDPWSPTRIHWLLYFDTFKDKGATVARSKFNALLWIQNHLELLLGLEATTIRSACNVKAGNQTEAFIKTKKSKTEKAVQKNLYAEM